jgi:20S proteasome alpha/beta subunit
MYSLGRYYPPDPEDIPMTFQVGMVGTDGVLLASDTRMLRQEGCRTSSEIRKICQLEHPAMACCAAGDDHTMHIRDQFLSLRRKDRSTPTNELLAQGANERWKFLYGDRSGQPFQHSKGSILVAEYSRNIPELWMLEFGESHFVAFVGDKILSGDAISPAAFFIERYYRSTAKISELLPLAAHAILMAARLNPTGVGGLEIVVGRDGQFQKLDEDEIAPFRTFSETLDTDIRNRFKAD